MSRFGRLAATAALLTATQAEAKDTNVPDAGATAPLIAERCNVNISSPKLTSLADRFNAELTSAIIVTTDDKEEYERQSKLDFAKTLKKFDFTNLKRQIDRLQRQVENLEDERAVKDATEKLTDIKGRIKEISKQMDTHSVLNSAGTYDSVAVYFTPNDDDVIKKDVAKVFAKYEKKGVECPSEVQNYIVKFKEFPDASDLSSALVVNADTESQNDHSATVPDLSSGAEKSEFKTPKAQFQGEIDKVNRMLSVQESRAERLREDIMSKYSFFKK